LRYWLQTDRKICERVLDLVEAVMREPFTGIGKPVPLKFQFAGAWSRRLTQEHRVVYLVSVDRVDVLQPGFIIERHCRPRSIIAGWQELNPDRAGPASL
jgi:toxin YoeB